MSRGGLIMLGMILGSVIGGYIPVFFGANLFSFISIIGNGTGGLLGVWLVYKLTHNF